MSNFLMLLIAAGTSSHGASTHAQPQPQAEPQVAVAHAPVREQGDFRICDDGRVLVYPASHPKSCS